MIDSKTQRLALPLPNVDNYLEDDVARLSDALTILDQKVATVGDDGKVTLEQLPAVAITDTFPVNSADEMLALNAQKGDVAIVTSDSGRQSYILMAEPASTLSNWKLLNDNQQNEKNLREQWRRSLAEAGLTLVGGSFEEGATANNKTDAVWYIAGGQCYTWDSTFPRDVPVKSTPATTGGVGVGAWVSVEDAHSNVEERLLGVGAKIYQGSNGQYVQNGDTVPVGTTHLAVVINGKAETVAMSPIASGAVSLLTEVSAKIGTTSVKFSNVKTKEFPYLYNSNGDLVVDGLVSLGDKVVVDNYHENGTSGVLFFRVVATGTGTADGGKYIDLPASGLQLEQNLREPYSVKAWGAKGNGVTDDRASIQSALDYAYEYNATVYNDAECFVSQGLEVKTSFFCRQPIISNESFSDHVVTIDYDTIEDLTGMIGSLSGFVKGSTKINGLRGYKNKTISIKSSEIDINRIGFSKNYEKLSTHLVTTDDGVLVPPIPFDYNPALITNITARGSERPIDVSLWIQIKSQTEDPIDRTVVKNRRSFVTLSDLRIENKTENFVPIMQGLSVVACSNVVIDRPKIDGFHYAQLGYAIALYESSLIEINNGQVTHSRKGIDGWGSDTVKIFGGTYQGSVGSHWGRNYVCDSVTTSSGSILPYTGVDSQTCFFGAGSGFKLKNCKGYISSVINPRLFQTRDDSLSLSGDVQISGCEMYCFDCTGNPIIFGFAARAGSVDYGRDVISPKNLVIEDNSVTYDGAVYATSFLMSDCINDYTIPETLYVSSDSTNQRVAFELLSSAGSCLTDSADYFLSGTGLLVFKCADSTTVRVNATGMVGGVLVTGQSLSRTVIENSTIDRIWHAGGSTDYRIDRVISLNNCRISPAGNWEARYWYEFKSCRFDGEISWAVVDPKVRVIYTAGNQGTPTLSFGLNGTYRTQ